MVAYVEWLSGVFEKRWIGFGKFAMRKLASEGLAVTGTGSQDL